MANQAFPRRGDLLGGGCSQQTSSSPRPPPPPRRPPPPPPRPPHGGVSALQPPVTFLHLAEARSLRLGSQRHICANPIIKRCVPESRHIDAQDVHVWDGSIGG